MSRPILVLLFLLTLVPTRTTATTCLPLNMIAALYQSDAAFLGTLMWTPNEPDPVTGIVVHGQHSPYLWRVERCWKGGLADTVRVSVFAMSRRFVAGDSVLLFAWRRDGQLTSFECSSVLGSQGAQAIADILDDVQARTGIELLTRDPRAALRTLLKSPHRATRGETAIGSGR